MTDLRTAARQALEALDKATRYMSDSDYRKLNDAIDILKAALEQPEQDEAPVAWMFQHEETGRMNYVSNDGYAATGRFLEMNPRYALVCALYTHPRRREWRELTDAELREAYLSVSGNEWCLGGMANAESFYEAIEAKLKERNA
jgi:hypothetical protein